MADDPTLTPTNDPPPNPPATSQSDGLSANEVKALVGEAVDEKLQAFSGKFTSKDDLVSFRTEIIQDLTTKIPELIPQGKTLDETSLLAKVGELLDGRLAKIGVPAGRTPGALGRWLLGE